MGLEFWANISVVWLSALCFVGIVIPLAATYYAIRGMHAALGISFTAFKTAQTYSGKIRSNTESVSQKIARPVIRSGSEAARADKVIRSLTDDISS